MTISSDFEQIIKFVEQIRADEREKCALICENMERNGAWITKSEAAAAIRVRGIDAAIVAEVGIWGEENLHDHVDIVTNSTNPVQNPHKHKDNI